MSGQHTWPDTLDIMGWEVDPQGLGVIFDRAIPPFAEANLGAGGRRHPRRAGVAAGRCRSLRVPSRRRQGDHAPWSGRCRLEQGSLDHERVVLADYGNMSAPTALFVLDRIVEAGLAPRTLLTALGPGFTASCLSLRSAA